MVFVRHPLLNGRSKKNRDIEGYHVISALETFQNRILMTHFCSVTYSRRSSCTYFILSLITYLYTLIIFMPVTKLLSYRD
jgi:hypothetical protein